MSVTRRTLIHNSVALATAVALPLPLTAALRYRPDVIPPIEDPDVKHLAETSLGSARDAGARYADARITHTHCRRRGTPPAEEESMTFGVRVLVDGYWGFSASPVWTRDEAARLGRAAVRQARANALGQVRDVTLAPIESNPADTSNHWTMPIKDDPFEMSWDEVNDFFGATSSFISRIPGASPSGSTFVFYKQDRAFASTEGQYYTQRLYRTEAAIGLKVQANRQEVRTALNTMTPAGLGFEHIRGQPVRDQILALVEEVKTDSALPFKPLDVGRYSVVLDAQSVAYLMNGSIGLATELDRALGFEANAGGTSYIVDPLTMLGSMKIGSPIVRVTGNRSEPGGVATVRWDDEGVQPKSFTLIEKGILSGMQTNREGASWLREYYAAQQMPVTSYGCSYAPEAIHAQTIHCANLQIEPSAEANSFDSLIAGLDKGIAFKRTKFDMDFQQITGMGMGNAYEINKGKRVARLPRAGIMFRTPEIWNTAIGLGDAKNTQRFGIESIKGEPRQISYHSVTSVPMAFKDLTVVDVARKA